MFLAVPVGILAFISALIPIQNRIHRNVGLSWLMGTIASGLVWLWSLYAAFLPTGSITLLPSVTVGSYPLKFILDSATVALAITLSSIYAMTFLTMITRFEVNQGVAQFVFLPVLALASYLCIAANSLWVIALSWTLFDLTETIFRVRMSEKSIRGGLAFSTGAFRVLSTFLVTVSYAVELRGIWIETAPISLPYLPRLLVLIAAGLRSGVIPPHQNGATVSDSNAKAEIFTRMAGLLIVFPLLIRTDLGSGNEAIPNAMTQLFSWVVLIAGLVACGGWILSNRSVVGMNFFLLYNAALPFAVALRSNSSAALGFSIVPLFAEAAMIHHNSNYRIIRFMLGLFLILMSGFPYTPTAGLWSGILDEGFSLYNTAIIFTHSVILIGFAISIIRERAYDPELTDRWTRTGFPFLYALIFASAVYAAVFGWGFRGEFGGIHNAGGVFTMMILGGFIYYQYRMSPNYRDWNIWARTISAKTTTFLNERIELKGGGALFRSAGAILVWIDRQISEPLERNGGLLWEILYLIAILIFIADRAGLWG